MVTFAASAGRTWRMRDTCVACRSPFGAFSDEHVACRFLFSILEKLSACTWRCMRIF